MSKLSPLQYVKNILNQRINPAKNETLAGIKSDTASVITNTGALETTFSTIETNVAHIPAQGRTSSLNSTPVAIASNQPTLNVVGSMTFDTPAKALRASDDNNLFYLRKIVKQLESLNTVDSARRQRIVVDGSVDLSFTTTAAVTSIAAQGTQMYQDIARNEYANGIRKKLAFH